MPNVGVYYFNNTELSIITSLFIYRSGTAEQITYMIQPELAKKITNKKDEVAGYSGRTKYIARLCNNLAKRNLVTTMKTPHSMRLVYFLTQEGLNFAYTVLGIEEHSSSLASGWSGDYGYFDYHLYKPSIERFMHHNLSVNFHIQMLHHASLKQFNYEFIDNRYASREFTLVKEGRKMKRFFRPDGEFKINDINHYWIEIDMSTERGEKLADKFESYRDYLDVISEGIPFSEMNETPHTIVFHSSAIYIATRWISVLNAFLNKMNHYTGLINFRLTNNSTLEHAVVAELSREEHQNKVLKNLQFYLMKEEGFLGLPDTRSQKPNFIKLLPSDEKILGWSPNIIIVDKSDGTKQIFLFERFEGMESIGLARIVDFNKKFKSLEIGKTEHIKEIIPVLYFFDVVPNAQSYTMTSAENDLRGIFNKLILHDAKNNLWLDGNDQSQIHTNPLMYRC
ncbi:replication-relaxation family protein [Paenibacillus terrae]|uniref:Replication-relaxation n=1 Tax=Paenibacillus terrae TaxID=159743 RepID=A0A0D7WUC1_9BACL|nr:replication-relaxation family protein [Paenibacillus terrae]KJD42313.1 hypothetical protein QD47_28960 [Paenibacillus terrae]